MIKYIACGVWGKEIAVGGQRGCSTLLSHCNDFNSDCSLLQPRAIFNGEKAFIGFQFILSPKLKIVLGTTGNGTTREGKNSRLSNLCCGFIQFHSLCQTILSKKKSSFVCKLISRLKSCQLSGKKNAQKICCKFQLHYVICVKNLFSY